MAAVFAAALIWLLLSDPVSVADAVNEGGATSLMLELGRVIYQALLGLLDQALHAAVIGAQLADRDEELQGVLDLVLGQCVPTTAVHGLQRKHVFVA